MSNKLEIKSLYVTSTENVTSKQILYCVYRWLDSGKNDGEIEKTIPLSFEDVVNEPKATKQRTKNEPLPKTTEKPAEQKPPAKKIPAAAEKPKPATEKPKPATEKPKPAAEKPKPAAEKPKPAAQSDPGF